MKIYNYFIIISLGLNILNLNIFAQDKNAQDKKKLFFNKVKKLSTEKTVLRPNTINFHTINKSYYIDKKQLSQIKLYENQQDEDNLFSALYHYIENFSVENFSSNGDMLLIWKLARLSEYKNFKGLSRDLYRLIIKHHRDSLSSALKKYQNIINFREPNYTDISYYYELVGKIKAVDTIHVPKDIMLDMGEEINSPFPDYGLTIGHNDNIMYFSSERIPESIDNLLGFKQKTDENLYVSYRLDDGYWSEAKPLEELNTRYKEGSPSISEDGNILVFTRCHTQESFGNCDLYICYWQEDNTEEGGYWLEAQNMGAIINSYAWDSHPALVDLGDTLFLYFASDRRGGFGGTDIYYSYLDKNDPQKPKWTKVKNLGPYINSQFNEVSPFINKSYKNVLYFSSDAQLINFGDFDIFKTFKVNGKWIEPKNVGPLVNGKGSEFYFTIDSRSLQLFYARSEKDDIENLDLHSFHLPMEAKPNNIIRFSGRVVEPVTGEVFTGKVSIIDLDEGTPVAPRYLKKDAAFEFELINQRNYLLVVEGLNFFRVEKDFFLDGDTELDIEVNSIKRSITFQSIDFKKGKSDILAQMENNLHTIIDFLNDHDDYYLEVIGHTDSDGDVLLNLKLSQERAKNIKIYLLKYGGFKEDRIISNGLGNTKPLIKLAKTEEEKKLNRRVEFNIIHKRFWRY